MRRFGWQISGISVAVAAVVVLGLLAFGCGSGSRVVGVSAPKVTPRPTPTADPRVAAVEAAARRYVQALEDSAKSGNPSAVDALVVPGSQAAGNAGIASSFSRDNHYVFVAATIGYAEWRTTVNDTSADVAFQYTLFGHAADWPSLKPREPDRTNGPISLSLEFELHGDTWLVSRSS